MDITDRYVRRRQDDLGHLIDELFPRQRGRKDDDDDDDDDDEDKDEKPTKKAPKTVVRTRYRTLDPTFSGSIAGYSTRRQKDDDDDDKTTTTKAKSTSTSTSTSSTPTLTPAETTPARAPETQLPAATESAAPAPEGMSGGAKAGIGIGAAAGVLALVGLVFFLLARKRRQKEGMSGLDDEKMGGAFVPGGYAPTPSQAAAASAAAARAPGAYAAPGNHAQVSSHAPVAAGAMRSEPRSPGSPWERPNTSSSQNAANPFGSHAELPGSRPSTPPSNHTAVAAAVAGGIGAMAGASATRGLQRQTSRQNKKQLDLTLPPPGTMAAVPPSPARTEYSVSSVPSGQAAPVTGGSKDIAAAGGPSGSGVHRVQLDFEPTLEDELGLKAGQLVRVLHEYDDGWALCIKLDRSRQGVVPRTCLSTRPVKPRSGSQGRAGPPVNPTPKSSPPPQNGSRPTTPGQSQSGPRYQPMPPRPHASPGPARVMSPAPGPLSAPMPAPVSSTASVVSSLSPSEREPSPRQEVAEMPAGPVLKEGPAIKPVEFTPLPPPASSEPIGELEVKRGSAAPSAAGIPLPASPMSATFAAGAPGASAARAGDAPARGSDGAPKRKPVPGQA